MNPKALSRLAKLNGIVYGTAGNMAKWARTLGNKPLANELKKLDPDCVVRIDHGVVSIVEVEGWS